MNIQPKITIITPNYNQVKYIEACIKSVIEQNYLNLEWIIIDAESNDGSIDIIEQYREKFSTVIIKKDKGTYDAVNKGLKIATGDYICVLNSDDIFLPHCLKNVAEYIQKNNYPDWLTGGIEVLNENSTVKAKVIPTMPNLIANYSFLNRCWIYHPCTFIKKEVMTKIGYFAQANALDYEYWLRMEQAGYTPMVIQDYLSGLRFHSDCKSFDYQKITKEVRDIAYHFIDSEGIWNSATRQKIKDDDILIFKYKAFNYILQSRKIKAVKESFNFLLRYPSSLKKRWYWGVLRRVFTGVDESEFSPVLYLQD